MPQTPMFNLDAEARAKETGRLLAQYLKRAGVAQKELAAYLDVADTYISRMVRGHIDWTNGKYFGRIASRLKLKEDEIRRLQPAAVVDYAISDRGVVSDSAMVEHTPIVQIQPNLRKALDILAAEDRAYADPIFAEKLAIMDPEDGNTDPSVSWWLELAAVIMRRYKRG